MLSFFIKNICSIKASCRSLRGAFLCPIPYHKPSILFKTNKKYRKKQSKLGKISAIRYKKYPKFVELMNTRFSRYNEILEYIYELERQGKVFIIQPETPLNLGRIEKNREKLTNVYNMKTLRWKYLKK